MIEDREVGEIYKTRYWDTVRADELPHQIRYTVFDMAVNAGPKRAIMMLQKLGGVVQDGVPGDITLTAAERVTLSDYTRAREDFYKMLVARNATQGKFLNGWLRRVTKVHNRTIALLG